MNNQPTKKDLLFGRIVELCKSNPYHMLNKGQIAVALDISPGLIYHYFKDIGSLKIEVLKYAIEKRIIPILAHGLAVQDPLVLNVADDNLRKECSLFISGV